MLNPFRGCWRQLTALSNVWRSDYDLPPAQEAQGGTVQPVAVSSGVHHRLRASRHSNTNDGAANEHAGAADRDYFAPPTVLTESAQQQVPAATPIPPTAEFVVVAQRAADAAELTLNDLPSSWTVLPPEDRPKPQLSEECAILNQVEFPGQVAMAESDAFTGPVDQELRSTTVVFPSTDAAQDAQDTFNSAFSRCGEELANAFEKLWKNSLSNRVRP